MDCIGLSRHVAGLRRIFFLEFFILLLFFPLLSFAVSSPQPVAAKNDMVVTEERLATEVGADILKEGGNAIDAAVAVGYALAVVYPCCGNIGGGGLMVLHLANGKNTFFNFREKAPLAAKSNMYLDTKGNIIPKKSLVGFLAVGVPGTVLGLETALKKYGTMTREHLMAPAIKLANQGFLLTPHGAKLLKEYSDDFRKHANIAAIFLNNNQPFHAWDRLVQKNLADTLNKIAKNGPDVFYHGEIASAIVKASQAHGGILKMKDFADYNVEELAPIHCTYHGYTIITAPPPSTGGITLCEMLNILEYYPLTKMGYHSAHSVHFITEAMRFSFADRNFKLGDPDFVHNPIANLLAKNYAANIRHEIQNNRATPSAKISEKHYGECMHTTHYSILDKWGNAVALTYTLNSHFGARVIAGNTGFFLNNEMDDFTSKPCSPNQYGLIMGKRNNIQPGKRPLSSLTPTIVLKDGRVVMVLGSRGGPRIITAVLQTILNVLDYDMNIQEAVDAPRFHHQWLPDTIYVEPHTFTKATESKLSQMGYHLTHEEPWGAVQAIAIDPTTGIKYGAYDHRYPSGKAMGHSSSRRSTTAGEIVRSPQENNWITIQKASRDNN